MDIALLSLFSLYIFLLFACGITSLVFQFIGDYRQGASNPLEPWHLKWSEAFLIGWGLLTAVLALSIAIPQAALRAEDRDIQLAIQVAGWQGGLLLILIALIYLYPRQFHLTLNPQKPGLWRIVSQAVVQLLAAFILFMLVALCWRGILLYIKSLGLGDLTGEQELIGLLAAGLSMPVGVLVALLVAAVIIAPVAEEILFRGLLYRFLKSRISARWAMIASSVCFGAIHGNMASFIPLTFLGMILVRAYERTGSLKVPILMHALFNANTTFIVLINPYIEEMSDKFTGS